MAARLAEALAPLFLEHAQLRTPRLAFHDRDHSGVRDKWSPSHNVAGVLFDEQHLVEGELGARIASGAVDLDSVSRCHLHLASARLDNRKHVFPLRSLLGPTQRI